LSTAWSNKSVIVIAIGTIITVGTGIGGITTTITITATAGACAMDICTGITGTRIAMVIGIQDAIGIELNRAIDVTEAKQAGLQRARLVR
jgi:hypothetical protein